MINVTILSAFTLSGLNDTSTKYRVVIFFLTLLTYCVILLVNAALIVTVILEGKLHEPMYIFLCNLCFNSLYGTAAFYPKFLFDLLSNSQVISYTGCLLQIFVIYSYAATEFSVLAVMAYDRYVAICRPLQYHLVMTKYNIVLLVSFSTLVPLFNQAVVMIMTSKLTLCGSHIDKLYCENWSILKLSCNSVTTNNIVGFILIFFYFGYILFIVCSYVQLVKSAIRSREGRSKFIQTCIPHLLCLLNVTVALLFDLMYARYGSASLPQSLKNFMAIQFLLIPPILNPIIYGLKLTQVRNSLLSLLNYHKHVKM
ncbi:Olfactory receptor 2C1 OLFmf3 Olfactory receptor 2C2 [Channa argus]|uniref:Olfactory receptor 2C1 OLFmf3 Olfactory receptor 2C2 n=1 Tax=Channa argus TaxID=215402 RepID=A0A6G1PXQ1_CHAAH|nr:Olfactory receptor 2C1 OLFmf3 Olfactory receptor 2C2 [Channa argus]